MERTRASGGWADDADCGPGGGIGYATHCRRPALVAALAAADDGLGAGAVVFIALLAAIGAALITLLLWSLRSTTRAAPVLAMPAEEAEGDAAPSLSAAAALRAVSFHGEPIAVNPGSLRAESYRGQSKGAARPSLRAESWRFCPAGVPGGSWAATARNVSAEGGRLTAELQKNDGSYVSAFVEYGEGDEFSNLDGEFKYAVAIAPSPFDFVVPNNIAEGEDEEGP